MARASEVASNSSHSSQYGSSMLTSRRLAMCHVPGRKAKAVAGMDCRLRAKKDKEFPLLETDAERDLGPQRRPDADRAVARDLPAEDREPLGQPRPQASTADSVIGDRDHQSAL